MSSLKTAVLMGLATPLGSCVSAPKDGEPTLPAGHNFSYSVPRRESVDLIQVFDDGSSTYLQFRETPAASIDVRREISDVALGYTVDERYLKIPGVYDRLRVTVAKQSADVVNEALPAPPETPAASQSSAVSGAPTEQTRREPMSAVIALEDLCLAGVGSSAAATQDAEARRNRAVPVGVPESLQTMHANLKVAALKQEISSLEERVRRLSAEIEEAQRARRGVNLYIRDMGASPRVVLRFSDNSFEAQVDEDLLELLGSAARAANRIYLHGHTDAYVASETGTALAIRRAVEVRRLLVSLNVEPERIRLFYRGAGNFVANNSTLEGKALNRRVEIELRKW
jgi:outer membrane protein OmpA-like peptidoglycan-associated protein